MGGLRPPQIPPAHARALPPPRAPRAAGLQFSWPWNDKKQVADVTNVNFADVGNVSFVDVENVNLADVDQIYG